MTHPDRENEQPVPAVVAEYMARQTAAAQDRVNGQTLIASLFLARPDGRTLASVAEEKGWTLTGARRALAAARAMEGADRIAYAADGNTLRLVPTKTERQAAARRGEDWS